MRQIGGFASLLAGCVFLVVYVGVLSRELVPAFVIVVSAMAIAIPFVAVSSVVASRTRRLPRWFAYLGIVAAVGLAGAYWYLPLLGFLVWISCGSLLLATASPPDAAQ